MNIDIIFRTILSLFGLWFVVYYLWQDFRNDVFRDQVFSIRDRMFLYAAEGNVSFDHPAYSILRNRMNSVLRHGHEFTLMRVLLVAVMLGNQKNDTFAKWEVAVDQLPDQIQEKMREFNTCVAVAVLQHILYCSFFRYILLRPLAFLIPQPRKVAESPKMVLRVEQLESQTIEREARLLGRAVA